MTSPGASRSAAFAATDWGLLVVVGLMWGASFLLIKLGLEAYAPETVAWFRVLFGAATLALLPAARSRLDHPRDWWLVGVLGLTWMGIPFVLFTLAQQTIDSSLAGMINGSAPLFTVLIAALWFRHRPNPSSTAGLMVGLIGMLAITVPSVTGGATLHGVLLALGATMLYGVAFNLSGHLQRRNGALSVILRAQLVAVVATTPLGLVGLGSSTPTWAGTAAVVLLGAVCTGVAFAFFVTLVGRVGAPRASITIYLIPGVAILLGALVAGESIEGLAIAGIALVLLGAYLTSRGSGTPDPTPTA